jgi:hypothetical protein
LFVSEGFLAFVPDFKMQKPNKNIEKVRQWAGKGKRKGKPH